MTGDAIFVKEVEKSEENNEEVQVIETKQEKLEKSGKKVRVIALTNEYIMSLENLFLRKNKKPALL